MTPVREKEREGGRRRVRESANQMCVTERERERERMGREGRRRKRWRNKQVNRSFR